MDASRAILTGPDSVDGLNPMDTGTWTLNQCKLQVRKFLQAERNILPGWGLGAL